MPDAIPGQATPAPVAAPPSAAATPAAAPATQAPAAAPSAPVASSSTPPVAAGDAKPEGDGKAVQTPKERPEVIKSLIGGDAPPPEAPKEGEKPADAKPADAPVYDIKLPEGVEVDAPQMEAAKAIFAKAKIAPEAAQELATFHAAQLQAVVQKAADQQVEAWNGFIRDRQKEVMADPDIGGTKFTDAKNRIENGLQTFFGIQDNTPADAPERKAHADFIGVLQYTGAGSTLPMLKLLDKLVSSRSVGKPVQGNGPAAPPKSLAERMYPPKQAAE